MNKLQLQQNATWSCIINNALEINQVAVGIFDFTETDVNTVYLDNVDAQEDGVVFDLHLGGNSMRMEKIVLPYQSVDGPHSVLKKIIHCYKQWAIRHLNNLSDEAEKYEVSIRAFGEM